MPEHFLLPEEEDLSYLDYMGAALKTAFPKTALAYDVLEKPVREGVASAIKPWGPRLDIVSKNQEIDTSLSLLSYFSRSAMDQDPYAQVTDIVEEVGNLGELKAERKQIVKDKISRFVKGALGKRDDYVEEMTDEYVPLKFEKRDGLIDFERTEAYLHRRERMRDVYKARTDILSLGFGLSQRYDSMVESEYKPTEEELRQITTKDESAYVGQVGWKPDRPEWDFKDKERFGVYELDPVLRRHGSFRSPKMGPGNEETFGWIPPEEGYKAFSDVWDFSIMDQPLIQGGGSIVEKAIDKFAGVLGADPIFSGKSIGPTVGEALDYLEFYQAPQIYGRRDLELGFDY